MPVDDILLCVASDALIPFAYEPKLLKPCRPISQYLEKIAFRVNLRLIVQKLALDASV